MTVALGWHSLESQCFWAVCKSQQMTSKEVYTSDHRPSWLSNGHILTESMVLKWSKDVFFWMSDQSKKRAQENSSLFHVSINVQDSNMGTQSSCFTWSWAIHFGNTATWISLSIFQLLQTCLPKCLVHEYCEVCSPNITQGDPLRTLPSWKLETSPISEAAKQPQTTQVPEVPKESSTGVWLCSWQNAL